MDLEHNKDNSEVIGENSHLLQRKNSAEFFATHFPHKNTTNFQVKHNTNPYLRFSLRAWFRVTTALFLVVITSLACAWVNEVIFQTLLLFLFSYIFQFIFRKDPISFQNFLNHF
jgi:hypothetical protein